MTTRGKARPGRRDDPHPSEPLPSTDRSLPHNLEAERSVLGVVIAHDGYEVAAEVLRGEDFYRDAHRRLWDAVGRLVNERKVAVDFLTLKEELLRVGELDEVGGPAYIAGLVDGIPRATNLRYYAGIVRDKARLRSIIYAANKALLLAYEGEETLEHILETADKAFLDIRDPNAGRLRSLREGMSAFFERIEYRYAHRGELTGIDTGFPSLNGESLGWQRGDLNVVAARPSIGKTAFLINSMLNAARGPQAVRVAYFSLEMTEVDIYDRIVANVAGIDAMRIRSGQLGALDFEKVAQATNVIAELPIFIDERVGLTVPEIRSAARRMAAEHGVDHIVIDYGQLIGGSLDARRHANRNEEMTDIVTRLKNLAGELKVPVTMASQLSRANEKRPDPRPKLSDLRESGAIEQVAAVVAFLHRKNHREGGTTEFILAKQRNGPTGTVNLTFDRDLQTFTDGGDPIPDDPPAERKPRKGRKTSATPSMYDEPPPPDDADR